MDEKLLGKCGIYCGCCPTYLANGCRGCTEEHEISDCFTRDCVLHQKLSCCEECKNFPCETILTQPHTTALDKAWLLWKKGSRANH